MSPGLDAFRMTAATREPAPPRTPTEAEYLSGVGNLLLDLADLADEIGRVRAKRDRIVARLDDPALAAVATPAMRAEAEARAGALFNERERHLKEFRRKALRFCRLYGALPPELREWMRLEGFPVPCWDGVAAVVGGDRTLMGQLVLRDLVAVRAIVRAKEEAETA